MSTEKSKETGLSLRAMLTRLGLAATAAYTAPVLLRLGEAHASSFSRSGRRSFSGRKRSGRRRRSFT